MMDFINKLLEGDTLKFVIAALVVINAALSAVSVALEKVGKSALVPAWIKPVVVFVQKVIDFASANIKHK